MLWRNMFFIIVRFCCTFFPWLFLQIFARIASSISLNFKPLNDKLQVYIVTVLMPALFERAWRIEVTDWMLMIHCRNIVFCIVLVSQLYVKQSSFALFWVEVNPFHIFVVVGCQPTTLAEGIFIFFLWWTCPRRPKGKEKTTYFQQLITG